MENLPIAIVAFPGNDAFSNNHTFSTNKPGQTVYELPHISIRHRSFYHRTSVFPRRRILPPRLFLPRLLSPPTRINKTRTLVHPLRPSVHVTFAIDDPQQENYSTPMLTAICVASELATFVSDNVTRSIAAGP
ncbi:hypothetical protein AWENTII_011180 [Aspergillus wentii]|nr:hypothetical protein MW887_003696 [Aspergillus wentii]